MPDPWSRLSAPFPPSAVRWHAVATDPSGGRVRLAPHVAPDALRARLDETVGPEAWSIEVRPWGADGLIAEATIRGVARAGVVRLPAAAGLDADDCPIDAGDAATGAAWSAACAAFGMRAGVASREDGWVDVDAERGEPLFRPETVAVTSSTAGAADAPAPTGGATPSDAAPTPAGPLDEDAKPQAHQVIDRLVDRLRSEGLGTESARLIASYGGYGADPAASRELYAKLRALLLERGTPT